MEQIAWIAIYGGVFVGGFFFGRAYQLKKEIERVEALHRLHALSHHYLGLASEPHEVAPSELPKDSGSAL